MPVYYNEHDPFAARWLRQLIAAGDLPDGLVDERSIEDVLPSDLTPFTQCHFFAGIGGWAHALRLAGWPSERPVWTGSCPCQPFSAAGKGAGFADDRHLWPAFHWLIEQCRPDVVLGEQVASALPWLDLVSTDLENSGYAVGTSDLCAAGVGAAHIRQRLYWVADRQRPVEPRWAAVGPGGGDAAAGERAHAEPGRCGLLGGLGDAGGAGGWWDTGTVLGEEAAGGGERGEPRGVAHVAVAAGSGLDDWEWLPCRDGKWRPTQPGIHPLAHGIPGRVGRLRGFGNAIVPQVAEAFIRAYVGAQP